jgi:hypothetical protein
VEQNVKDGNPDPKPDLEVQEGLTRTASSFFISSVDFIRVF